MNPGSLKHRLAVSLALLAMAGLAPLAAHAQSANPAFRSATSATLGGAVSFRAAASAATTGATLAIPRPAGTVENDVMIAAIGVRPATASVTPPAGWILVRRVNNSSGTANALAVYRKLAGAAEPDSYSWTLAGSTHAVGGIQSFSGVDTASPINVESGGTTGWALTHPTPSVSTTVANTVLVTSHTFSSAASWTPPAGMTEGFDIATPAPPNAGGQAIEGNWVRMAAAGATGIKTATASNDADVGNTHILALRPVANTLSVGLPAGTVANDVMIASIGVSPSTATITPPEGWTLVRRINNANSTANSLAVYRKVAGTAEPASYAWGVTGASYAVGGIQAFFNVDTVNPINVENGQTTAKALGHSTPSVVTTVPNTIVVTSHTFSSSMTWTPPAGMAESFDQPSGAASSAGQSIAGNRVLQAAAGATGVKTATAADNKDVGNAHILALRPATSGLNDATAPTVSIASPASGATVSGTISVSASATDNVGVVGVQFQLDGINADAEVTTAPYAISWNTRTAANASHTFTAVARDAAGNRTTSAPVTITVFNDTSPPTVSITFPGSGSTVSGTITVTASAVDNVGVAGVQFQLDGINIGAEAATAPHSVSWNTITAASGPHTLTAIARDAAGNLSTSAPVTVTVSNKATPYTGTPIPVPGSFEAENFDLGGESVAYHDNVKGNSGGQYRLSEDVDIILSADDIGGGYVVNDFETGEWLAYTVNVASSAAYDIEVRASSTFSTGAFHVEIDGVNVTGPIAVPNTGSWSVFQWVGKQSVPLTTGQHVLKIVADQQFFNLNSVRVAVTPPDTTAPSQPGTPVAVSVSSSTIDLSWSASTDNVGVAGYQVYRDGTLVASPAGTSVSITGLSASTMYSFTVAAVDATGNASALSAPLAVTTPAPPVSAVDCANPAGGYEGFGRNTTGGAGQPVYRVTNLNDSGAGSLRDAVSAGNRCIVFDVAGTISLSSAVLARGANITIDGFTAPSPGISLTGWGFDWHYLRGVANIIARGIRIRGTVGPESLGADGFQIVGVSNFVIDHVSIDGWGDGSIDITGENGVFSQDGTVQWSIIGKGRDLQDKSLLIKYKSSRISLHHNLFINANDRNPYCAWMDDPALTPGPDEVVCDIRNNLVWGYGWTGTSIRQRGTANVVNNYYFSSASPTAGAALYIIEGGVAYANGNYSPSGLIIDAKGNRATPFPAIVPTTTDALTAAQQVVAQAGARGLEFGLDASDLDYIGQISLTPLQ